MVFFFILWTILEVVAVLMLLKSYCVLLDNWFCIKLSSRIWQHVNVCIVCLQGWGRCKSPSFFVMRVLGIFLSVSGAIGHAPFSLWASQVLKRSIFMGLLLRLVCMESNNGTSWNTYMLGSSNTKGSTKVISWGISLRRTLLDECFRLVEMLGILESRANLGQPLSVLAASVGSVQD